MRLVGKVCLYTLAFFGATMVAVYAWMVAIYYPWRDR